MLQKGFTLIELMIVVAIIGILSMFALPAYQDYTKRTYISEGMALATGAKLAATEYFSTQGEWPANNKAAGIAEPAGITGQSVTSITLGRDATDKAKANGGTISILYNEKIAPEADAPTLKLRSSGTDGGSVAWLCAGKASDAQATVTGIQLKWLPANCRDDIVKGRAS